MNMKHSSDTQRSTLMWWKRSGNVEASQGVNLTSSCGAVLTHYTISCWAQMVLECQTCYTIVQPAPSWLYWTGIWWDSCIRLQDAFVQTSAQVMINCIQKKPHLATSFTHMLTWNVYQGDKWETNEALQNYTSTFNNFISISKKHKSL